MKQLLLVLNISMQKVESFICYLPCNGGCFDDEESLLIKKIIISCIFQLKACFIHKNALQNTDPGCNPEDKCITWAREQKQSLA